MKSWRSCVWIVCLAGGLSTAGCTDRGSYTVTWQFVGDELAATGCGKHGVDSIRVTGANAKGDTDDVTTLCAGRAPGTFTHEVPVGDWTFTLHQLDVRGRPITLTDAQGQGVPDPTATGSVVTDQPTDLVPAPVVLMPRPACSDGIDNDVPPDGRIDLDDPDCAGDPNTATECPATGC